MPCVNEMVKLLTIDGSYIIAEVVSVTPPSRVFTVKMKSRYYNRKIEFSFSDYNCTVIPMKKGA